MRKMLQLLFAIILIIAFCGCTPKGTPAEQNPTVVRTFEEGANGDDHIWIAYYEMSDGTWRTDAHTYQYCLVLEGDFAQITVLSNREDVTYDEALMNLGFSSLSTDYFTPEEAVIVQVVYNSNE